MTRSEAARINGAGSKGPVTEEGKRRSSLNAMKHGLTAARDKAFVCQNESQESWDGIYRDLAALYEPVGELDVAGLAHARWRVRNCSTIETGILDMQMDQQAEQLAEDNREVDSATRMTLAFKELAQRDRTLDTPFRYDIRSRRSFDRILRNLMQLQNARREKQILQNEPNTGPLNPAAGLAEAAE